MFSSWGWPCITSRRPVSRWFEYLSTSMTTCRTGSRPNRLATGLPLRRRARLRSLPEPTLPTPGHLGDPVAPASTATAGSSRKRTLKKVGLGVGGGFVVLVVLVSSSVTREPMTRRPMCRSYRSRQPSRKPHRSATSPATTSPGLITTPITTPNTEPPPATTRGNHPRCRDSRCDRVVGSHVADPDPARPPYIRDDYDGDGWADFDGDCISTRHELLITYSVTEPVLDGTCFVDTGQWIDPYDGTVYTSADQVTIDHVVPLAEAHRSGAWRWDNDSKNRFANDRNTRGISWWSARDINQSKADKTPDLWLPPDPAAHCQYAIDWTTTKARYDLTVTVAEHDALEAALDTCTPASSVRPVVDVEAPVVVITIPTTTTTTTIAPSAGPGVVTLLACNRYDEVVTIANTGGTTISLSGYKLHDEGDKHTTGLGEFGSLEPGQQLRLLSGPDAVNGDGAVVWTNQNVWNNDGDIAFLVAPDGTETSKGC